MTTTEVSRRTGKELLAGPERLIGESPAMREVRRRIRQVAASHVPVLILGETGTGKELCAEAIVRLSGRTPFVPVNCAAFSDGVIDSELFGHERGAFTGADRSHSGLIAAANGGVLFLDELAEVPPAVQAKLLRTLESGEYRPVGSTKVLHSSFRIIAATSGDPDHLAATGKLRPDLVHRLGALRVTLPPLRQRPADIPLLANHFVRKYRERVPDGPITMAPEAVRALAHEAWPGNVRQLRNVIEAAAALAGSTEEIDLSHLLLVLPGMSCVDAGTHGLPTLAQSVDEAEARALVEALRHADDNREHAARLLGISQATLYRKLAKHFRGDPQPDDRSGNGNGSRTPTLTDSHT